ncbi:MAG TPA: caspase family protein [Pseudolabrys sp.]
MRALGIFLFVLCILCGGGQQALAAKRVALVIGNSAYQNVARLSNPVNDAAAVADMFKKATFDVVGLRDDLTNAEMRRALREFSDKSRDADIAVIYYAGHGIEVDGTNYLIPVDATIERDTDAYDEAIALERIMQAVEPAKQLRLVILDACRDNPFARKMKRTVASRSLGRGLAGVEPNQPNTLVAFAAKGGSTASDGDSRNSPFTVALLKHLTTPGLEVRKAFGLVRDDVMASTGNRQEPFVYGSLGGNDVALVALPVAASGPRGKTAADVRQDYELAEKVGTREAWDSFVAAYPTGFYSDLAKAQRNKLAGERGREATPAKAAAETAAPATDNAAKAPAQTLAALPPAADAAPRASRPADTELPRLLQVELKRVGCQTGEIDGIWGASSQRALTSFNRSAGTRFEVKVASLDALDAVRGKRGRICPLVCESGTKAVGETCVAVACKPGFARDDDNVCRRSERRARTQPMERGEDPRTRRQAPPRQPAAASQSGQMICDDHGCRPVSRGCRAADSRGPYQTEVCN